MYLVDGRSQKEEKSGARGGGERGEDVELIITLLPVLHRLQRTVTAQGRGCEDISQEASPRNVLRKETCQCGARTSSGRRQERRRARETHG